MAKKGKTHKASKKRFKVTKKGKVMHRSQRDNSHLKANKDTSQKKRVKGRKDLKNKTQEKKVKEVL
jgi:ribosomal protein L35